MSDDTPRSADTCTECGTPLEVTEVMDSDGAGDEHATTLCLRCANGHTLRVTRHEAPDAS